MKNYFKTPLILIVLALLSNSLVAQSNGKNKKYNDKDYNYSGYSDKDYNDKNSNNSGITIAGWEKIGTKTVDKVTEVDEFRPSSRRSYSALKIRVKNNPVTINRMSIYYENGQKQEIDIRKNINDGEETRVIKLIGKRRIEKIAFLYKSKSWSGRRAEVEVWAKTY